MNNVSLELTDEELEELEFFVGCMSPSTLDYFCNHLGLKRQNFCKCRLISYSLDYKNIWKINKIKFLYTFKEWNI